MTVNRTRPRKGEIKGPGGGPRTAQGRAIVSRNALRHGFCANVHKRASASKSIERLTRAICGNDDDPEVLALGERIASHQLCLSEIAMHKVAVVERLQNSYRNPFSSKDNSLQLATARALQACLEHREITAQIPKLLKKYELKLTVDALSKRRDDYGAYLEKSLGMLFPDANKRAAIIEKWLVSWTESQTAHLKAQGWRTECDDIVPVRLKALLEEPEETEVSTHSHGSNSVVDRRHNRDAYDALEAAARDLIRLDRYQQGAWLRQKRAIHQLAKIRLDRRSACGRRPPTANDSRPSHPE